MLSTTPVEGRIESTIARIQPDATLLVARARNGDVTAFEAVYRMHAAHVFAVCRRLAGDVREAEELAQDAWVRAWEKLDTFRGDAAFATWMHRLAVNLLVDRKRKDARLRQRMVSMDWEARSQWGAPAVPPSGARLDLERAVAGLPEGARLVFLLHEVEGFKHREIADRLGVAVGTVKAQLHRARRLLREVLEK